MADKKSYPYPLTVVMDRYSGIFSGGKFTAWNRDPDMIPDDVYGGDSEAFDFWKKYHNDRGKKSDFNTIGFGNTVEEAIDDLISKLKTAGKFIGV